MSTAELIPLTTLDSTAQVSLFGADDVTTTAAPVALSFDDKVRRAIDAIKAQVLAGRRCAVAWSSGKDSSCTLNLALTACRELKQEGFAVPTLHVVHADTLLENPVVAAYSKRQIKQIESYSAQTGIPVRVWVASPSLSNDYLVSLLGGRTIASVGNNSKCQQLMKASALTRIKRQVRDWVAREQGVKPKEANLVSLIGTRFDESAQRARKMLERGESATEAVEAMANSRELVLSPIADFEAFDVFTYIGHVRSGKIECYDSFDELVEIYRDMNAGDCMVTAYIAGKEQARPPCAARTGCWICTRVSTDTSALNLIANEDGKFAWMKPLNDYRNYLRARHFDPSARCWLGRTVDEETGKIQIMPNAYSPEFTKELLGIALTIQSDEYAEAERLGIAPRFTLLSIEQIIAIDLLWGRYAYHPPFTAIRTALEVFEQGVRYEIPSLDFIPAYTEKDVAFRAEVPFADDQYHEIFNGLRNIGLAAADWEATTTTRSGNLVSLVNTGDEFEISSEGAELFWGLDLDYALSRVSLDDSPAAAVHYLLTLGTVSLFKGSESEWDRMLKVGNQIHRHQLQPIMNDPNAIMERLHERLGGTYKRAEEQMALF